MLQVPIPFQGLKWPCRYLQITALRKAALSGVKCPWPRGTKKKKQGARDTSKPLKNVMVFVEDLASGMPVCAHHSCSRHSRPSGEMVNIKGLCRSLPHESSWQQICLWPSRKEERVNDSSTQPLLHLKVDAATKKLKAAVASGSSICRCHQKCAALLQIFITYRQDVSDLRTKNLLTKFFKMMLIFIQECHTFQYSTINGHEPTQSCQHNSFTTINLNVRNSLNLQMKEKFSFFY